MISETEILQILAKNSAPPIKIQEILDTIITDALTDPQIHKLYDDPMQTIEINKQTFFVRGAKTILLCTGESAKETARNLRAEIYATFAAEICKSLWVMRAVKDENGEKQWRRMPFEPIVSIEPIASPDLRLACDPAIMTQQLSQFSIISEIENENDRLEKIVEKAKAKLNAAQFEEDREIYDRQLKIESKKCAEIIAQNRQLIEKIEKLGDAKFWLSRRSGRSWRISFFDPQRGRRRQLSCGDLVIFYNDADFDDPSLFVTACRQALIAPRHTRARTDTLHFDDRDPGFIGCFTGIGGKPGHESEYNFMVRRIDPKRTRTRQTSAE